MIGCLRLNYVKWCICMREIRLLLRVGWMGMRVREKVDDSNLEAAGS